MRKKLIAYIGVIGSGKDYNSDKRIDELEESGENVKKIGFSDAVREATFKLFNINPANEKDYELFKKQKFTMEGYCNSVYDLRRVQLGTGREMLQRVGTDVFRNMIDDDVWVNLWMKKVEESFFENDSIIVHDIRYENETLFLSRQYFVTGNILYCSFCRPLHFVCRLE